MQDILWPGIHLACVSPGAI